MTSADPVWMAMVLGAHARLLPTSYIANHRHEQSPEKAYFQLKNAIRKQAPVDVDILDIGPGSPERRRLLADSLQQHGVANNPQVQYWAQAVLKSTLKQSPRTITAAGFNIEDVKAVLQAKQR